MTYEIRCTLTGDVAEAEGQAAALLAADTLVRDHAGSTPAAGAMKAARRSLYICRLDDNDRRTYDMGLTEMARAGRTR